MGKGAGGHSPLPQPHLPVFFFVVSWDRGCSLRVSTPQMCSVVWGHELPPNPPVLEVFSWVRVWVCPCQCLGD